MPAKLESVVPPFVIHESWPIRRSGRPGATSKVSNVGHSPDWPMCPLACPTNQAVRHVGAGPLGHQSAAQDLAEVLSGGADAIFPRRGAGRRVWRDRAAPRARAGQPRRLRSAPRRARRRRSPARATASAMPSACSCPTNSGAAERSRPTRRVARRTCAPNSSQSPRRPPMPETAAAARERLDLELSELVVRAVAPPAAQPTGRSRASALAPARGGTARSPLYGLRAAYGSRLGSSPKSSRVIPSISSNVSMVACSRASAAASLTTSSPA